MQEGDFQIGDPLRKWQYSYVNRDRVAIYHTIGNSVAFFAENAAYRAFYQLRDGVAKHDPVLP